SPGAPERHRRPPSVTGAGPWSARAGSMTGPLPPSLRPAPALPGARRPRRAATAAADGGKEVASRPPSVAGGDAVAGRYGFRPRLESSGRRSPSLAGAGVGWRYGG